MSLNFDLLPKEHFQDYWVFMKHTHNPDIKSAQMKLFSNIIFFAISESKPESERTDINHLCFEGSFLPYAVHLVDVCSKHGLTIGGIFDDIDCFFGQWFSSLKKDKKISNKDIHKAITSKLNTSNIKPIYPVSEVVFSPEDYLLGLSAGAKASLLCNCYNDQVRKLIGSVLSGDQASDATDIM